jgi:hypothetical protein
MSRILIIILSLIISLGFVHADWKGELWYWSGAGILTGGGIGCSIGAWFGGIGCVPATAVGGVTGAIAGPIVGVVVAQHKVRPGMNVCLEPEGIRFAEKTRTFFSCYSQGTYINLHPTTDRVEIKDMIVATKDHLELQITVTFRVSIAFTPEVEKAIMANLYQHGVDIQVSAIKEPIERWFGKYMRTYTEAEIMNPEFFGSITPLIAAHMGKPIGNVSPFTLSVVSEQPPRRY